MAGSTIYDIAKKAGVSIATVSRVMNNNEGISDKTRKKVLKIADDLGYHPQAYAQGLARKEKNLIMVVVPVLSNYFFMEVLAGIQDEMSKYHYDLNIFNVQSNGGMFPQVENIIKRQLADGYIFISTHLRNRELEKLESYEVSITLIDENYPGIDSVSVDNEKGIQMAMHYFLDQGLKRIGMISAMKSSKPGEQRIKGYKKALEQAGVKIDEQLIVTGDSMYRDGFSEINGYEAMKKLLTLPNPPEACFCASDIQAVGALKAMKELDCCIPIIGYDDITISDYIGLSTIRQPMYDMGTYATHRLVQRMQDKRTKPKQKIFEPKLVLRSSTEMNVQERY